MWEWDGERLVGWVGSLVTPMKTAHLQRNPYISCNYRDGPTSPHWGVMRLEPWRVRAWRRED
jgi:hypothetical protein